MTEHDMQVKISKLRLMLKRQYRVRIRIQLKDRKNFDQELAREIMLNVAARVKDLALRDSRTGLKVETSAVYSLLVPRAPGQEMEGEEKPPAKTKTEKAPAGTSTGSGNEKSNKVAATSTAASAVENVKISHPAETM